MDKPLVAFINLQDYAGVAWNLAQAINRYTDWCAVHILKRPHKFQFPFDYDFSDSEFINSAIREARVIVFQTCYDWDHTRNIYPIELPDTDAKKAIWHGGSRYRNAYEYFNEQIHPHYDYVFAHRDLERLDKRIKRLDACVDTDKLAPIKKDMAKIRMGHSPSTNAAEHGSSQYFAASDRLSKEYPWFKSIIIENMTWQQATDIKRNMHLYMGEITDAPLPSKCSRGYGVGLMESAAYECICFDHSEYKDTPIISVQNANEIHDAVLPFIDNPDTMIKLSKKTRDWVVKTHGYKTVAEQFIKDIGGA